MTLMFHLILFKRALNHLISFWSDLPHCISNSHLAFTVQKRWFFFTKPSGRKSDSKVFPMFQLRLLYSLSSLTLSIHDLIGPLSQHHFQRKLSKIQLYIYLVHGKTYMKSINSDRIEILRNEYGLPILITGKLQTERAHIMLRII